MMMNNKSRNKIEDIKKYRSLYVYCYLNYLFMLYIMWEESYMIKIKYLYI